MGRNFVIGDIHGCDVGLDLLLGELKLCADDTVVTLGDYVDRGPGSKRVIERLIALGGECKHIALMGNHELMIVRALDDRGELRLWMMNGGDATLSSYGVSITEFYDNPGGVVRKCFPYEHIRFMSDCLVFHEDDDNIYVHANYHPDVAMDSQLERYVFWEHLNYVPDPHFSGKTVWVGHTPQESGYIRDMGHMVCVDSGSFFTGWLTAVETRSGDIIQANHKTGEIRRSVRKS